jgi:hypothetical protein
VSMLLHSNILRHSHVSSTEHVEFIALSVR